MLIGVFAAALIQNRILFQMATFAVRAAAVITSTATAIKLTLTAVCVTKSMKKLLPLFILILFIQTSSASPLILKSTKTITTNDQIELAVLDTSKYKQVRIGIVAKDRDYNQMPLPKEIATIELNSAKRELDRKTELLETGNISRAEYDQSKDRYDIALKKFNAAVENIFPNIGIYGVELNENILITALDDRINNRSFVVDSPPAKMSIRVFGKGTYSLYIWGSV